MKKMLPVLVLGLMLSLIALPVIADNENSNVGKKNKTIDLVKMQTAIDTRDTAIIVAWDAYSDVVKSALETRKTALKAAWTLTDKVERRAAIKTAWTNYRTGIKSIRENWRNNKKAAWTQWKIDSKTAKGNAEDNTSESVDNSL